MKPARPGQDGRSSPAARRPHLAWLALLAIGPGGLCCAPGDAAPRGRAGGHVAAEPRALASPAGRASAVAAIGWGGSPIDRRLGALFDDGRFAVYRPAIGPEPVSVGLVVPGRGRFSGLALSGADRAVTGDGLGLILWDTSQGMARPIDRIDCGAVGALAVEPIAPNDLLAGLEDGRLLRLRPDRERIGPALAEARSTGRAAAIRGLEFLDGGRSVMVLRADGRGERRSRRLDGPAEPIGPALAATEARGRLLRILGPAEDGPALEAIAPDGSVSWRFPLPADGLGLAPVLGGDGLIVGCEGRVLLMRPPRDGPPNPAEVRGLPAEGATRVAADPLDPSGRRVALADAAGRLLVGDAEELARSAAPIPLDNAAELAFRPQRRAYHPRAGAGSSAPATTSKRLADRIAEARRRLDRGEVEPLRTIVRDLEADPALDRDASAEVATLAAAVRQESGWPESGVRLSLGSARETFRLRGLLDREADLALWAGSLLIPPFDGRPGVAGAARIEEALAEFRAASGSYRRAGPGLERQARIAEAMAAWGLLALGRPREAQEAFEAVERFAERDPVLRQAPEFDRIAAALAVSRGDWEAADLASHRLLRRLTPAPPDRRALAREAALERVGDLAALGRWSEAAALLEPDRPDDPEWALRRATVRRRAGIDDGPAEALPPPGPADAPETAAEAHIRGRIAAAADATRAEGVALLAGAAEAHRRAGRSDLAIEADLERAEALERLGRPEEAIELFARAARTLAAEADPGRTRGAARPIGFATGRAHRGLARCQLALGRPAQALGALDRAALVSWFERSGEARVRSSALVAPPGGPTAPALREARRSAFGSAGAWGPPAVGDAAAELRHLEVRRAAEHRELAPADPTRPFDPSSLRLAEGEAVLAIAAIGPESLAGFLIRPGAAIVARILPATRSDLRRAARLWRASLGDDGRPCELDRPDGPDGLLAIAPEPDVSAGAGRPSSPGSDPAARVLDAVFGPFRDELRGIDRLVVVPDDAPAALPLEALASGGPESAGLPTIRYAPNLALLRRTRADSGRRGAGGRPVLVVSAGDPVLGLAVRSAYGVAADRVDVAADPRALPGRLVGGEGGPGVLHLAAVALLDPAAARLGEPELVLGAPGSSGLDAEGPRLSGADVLGLDLDGMLVLLWLEHRPKPAVAEPTAWRDLAACWLAAGAGAVVVSLWDPPADSSPMFAAELHRRLAEGLGPAEALGRARRALAARAETADPVHWAGYVLYDAGP